MHLEFTFCYSLTFLDGVWFVAALHYWHITDVNSVIFVFFLSVLHFKFDCLFCYRFLINNTCLKIAGVWFGMITKCAYNIVLAACCQHWRICTKQEVLSQITTQLFQMYCNCGTIEHFRNWFCLFVHSLLFREKERFSLW